MAAERTVPKLASSPVQPLDAESGATTEPQSSTSRQRHRSSRPERDRERDSERDKRDRDRRSDRRKHRDSTERDHRSSRSHSEHHSRRHHDEHRYDEHRRHHHRHRHYDSGDESPPAHKRALIKYQSKDLETQPQKDAEPLFFIDKRGDPLISKYGTNDRSKIPAYRRHGAGRLLGAKDRFTIIRDGANDEFTIGVPRDRGSIFREKHTALLKAGRSKGHRIKSDLISKEKVETGGEDQDFISLGRSQEQKQKQKQDPDESHSASDGEDPSYRSIHGKAKNHEFSDSDLDYESDDPTHATPDDDPRKLLSIKLSRQVKENPSDIDAWLELVGLQDYLISKEFGTQERTANEKQSLADIKLSMLEKALPHSSSQSDRERVLIQLMQAGSQKWDPKELAKRWQDITEENVESFDLWRARMDFEMTNLSTFTFDHIKTLYTTRIAWLQQRTDEASVTPQADVSALCLQLIYVFLRMTRFLQDAGYVELGVAMWQAVLELNFSRPSDLSQVNTADIKSSLADFWESEVARLGEPRAKGWKHFAQSTDPLDPPESKAAEIEQPPRTRDAYKAWASVERQQMSKSALPARTLDEDNNDDPFRVVLFSDIEDLLIVLPLPMSSQVQLLLLDYFLLFCQVEPYSTECSWIQAAQSDPFIVSGSFGLVVQVSSDHSEQEGDKKTPFFSHPNGHFAIGPETAFSRPHWFRSGPHGGRGQSTMVSLATLTMRQLVRNCGVQDLAAFSLLLDYAQDPKGVKKAGKALLKLYPSDISLYNAYAMAENANGNSDTAEKVLGAATSPDSGSRPEDTLVLWNTWAWIELETGHHDLALQRLCMISTLHNEPAGTGNTGVAPSQLLKTRQHLSSRRDYQLSTGNRDIASVFAQSYTLLEYLTAGASEQSSTGGQGNLVSALDAVFSFSDELCSRGQAKSLAHEFYLQFAARLVYFHASHGPYRPAYIREQLLRFIGFFPQNTTFLHLFAWAESSLRLNDPVREVLRTTVLVDPHDTLSTRIFAIQHELRVGNVYSVRAAFESALTSASCKGSVGLWRAYIKFAHERTEFKTKVKDVFYRAIKECPWSKELVMEAFGLLVRDMDSGELRGVYRTMQEKGLRIHVDMDEYITKWKEEQKATSRRG